MSEADLYPKIRDWIDARFPMVRGGGFAESHRKSVITADLHWIDGGAWMRPDLALVHVRRRRFDPMPSLDLYTFEVKPTINAALTGLHQTLAHARIADFVLFVIPQSDALRTEVIEQAERFGVGIVTFAPNCLWDGFEVRTAPRRQTPDPDLRDLFLSAALEKSKGDVDDVLAWLRPGSVRK
jgi:hypothetical protein